MSERGPEQDPRHDPDWETHQHRVFATNDSVIFQTEKYGTRARIFFGEPLNAQEIRWMWRVDLNQEEVAALSVDCSITSILLARKAQGAIAALGQRNGALGAKVDELTTFIAEAGERVALNGAGAAHSEAESEGDAPAPAGTEGGAESAL